jgi:LPXTG-motif cell wall-anchored protein
MDASKQHKEETNMKRLLVLSVVLVLSLALATSALAQSDMARVRVVHASPDAPAVDVWVNGNVAFSNAPFKGITDYASLATGSYQVQVTPTGASEPIVIDATLDLAGGTDYTVVAVGQLANIEPLVLVDNNSAPAAGKAHVRFVHASPDAPAVDIAVTGGPVLFSNVPFKGVGDYLPVDAGTYDLEARVAGTEDVALSVPGVQLSEGTVYTIFAMGLVGGEPALTAVPSVDAAAMAPDQLPETGGEVTSLWLVATLVAGLALIAGGLVLRSRKDEIAA